MNIYFIDKKKQIPALLGILKKNKADLVLIISHNTDEEKILKQRLAMNNIDSKILRKRNLEYVISNFSKNTSKNKKNIYISQLWKELSQIFLFDISIIMDLPSKNVNKNLQFLQEFNQIFTHKGFVLIPENKINMFTQTALNYKFVDFQDIDFIEDRSEELKFVSD